MVEGATILVAEDEDPLRKLYTEWLSQAGATVLPAENGEEALSKWTDDVDAVLLDRRMPEHYGGEVLQEAREKALHTPVAMVTAVTPDLDVIEMPFDDYVTKPVDREGLLRTVDELLDISETREVVREFVRAGFKLHKLQKEHSMELLKTHAEYQQLKRDYYELQDDVVDQMDDLTRYEMRLLVLARQSL